MNPSSKRTIGITEDWNELISSGVLKEGENIEGITFVSDGEKWGAKDWTGKPIIPIQYDYAKFDEFDLGIFHIVCKKDDKYDIYDLDGTPKAVGLDFYDKRDFSFVRQFICLANSYKRGGRCVAGIEVDSNNNVLRNSKGLPRWIRPIADTQFGEIPSLQANNVKSLSLVMLTDSIPCPEDAHTENIRFSTMDACSTVLPCNDRVLSQFVDNVHRSIFGNHGKAVSVEMVSKLDYSLMFIQVHNASAYIDEEREKSKSRMKFTYNETEYDLPITDPVFLNRLKINPQSFSNIPRVYLTLSLGLEFEGWHHKLISGVFIPDESPVLHPGISSVSSQTVTSEWFDEYEQELSDLLDQKKKIEDRINEIRQEILTQMEDSGVDKLHSDCFSVSYYPAKTVLQFDSKAFKTENEELYSNYCKPRQKDAFIVVKRNIEDFMGD